MAVAPQVASATAWRDLPSLLAAWGQPAFRLGQIREWKYQRLAAGFDEMSDVPAGLRTQLAASLPFSTVEASLDLVSSDRRTIKMLFRLADGEEIESVLMRQRPRDGSPRNTVCVSSQAGCKMRCSFCATGHGGWRRNLTPDEIVDQVLYFARLLKKDGERVTNIVFMGMGEPLDNYDNVLEAVRLLNSASGFGIGARSITVSTCGLVPAIRRLQGEDVQVNLAVSLAATTDERRSLLIPTNKRYPIKDLLNACDAYARATHRRVTFEYVLIAGVNDSPAEGQRLGALLAGRLAHVNLIPLNPVAGDAYSRPEDESVRRFQQLVRQAHVPVTVRYSKGVDIAAGCGQLRARSASATGV